jgi:hypothetical protein
MGNPGLDMNIIISLDYELFFGPDSGTVEQSMIVPIKETLKIVNKWNIPLSLFVDAGYVFRLQEYRSKSSCASNEYDLVAAQLDDLKKCGHDLQLHVHPHWEDSYLKNNKWVIDTTRYKLTDFPVTSIHEIVTRYAGALRSLSNTVMAFRAGGWCIQPFDHIGNCLKVNEIWLDSTVYLGGRNASSTHSYDFRNSPDETHWRFSDDPLKKDESGYFAEIPISSLRMGPRLYWGLAWFKMLGGKSTVQYGDGRAIYPPKKFLAQKLLEATYSPVSIDGYKASMLKEAYLHYKRKYKDRRKEFFVIMGHPKALTPYSLGKLDEFLTEQASQNNFITYQGVQSILSGI